MGGTATNSMNFKKNRFADVPSKGRSVKKIIIGRAEFNSLNIKNIVNKTGKLIKVLIGTRKAKEGLDLKHVRQVYIMDPWWNMVSVEQAMGRAVRFLSHYRVTKNGETGFRETKDRYVKIDLLISVFSGAQLNRIRNESVYGKSETMDQRAMGTALGKLETSREIEKILNKSAVDCGLYPIQGEAQSILCVNRFETTETGMAYQPSQVNEPTDLEHFQMRNKVAEKYFKIKIGPNDYYRPETEENIMIEYQTPGGLKKQEARLILYEDYQDSGLLVPAFAIIPTDDPEQFTQIQYPAFKFFTKR